MRGMCRNVEDAIVWILPKNWTYVRITTLTTFAPKMLALPDLFRTQQRARASARVSLSLRGGVRNTYYGVLTKNLPRDTGTTRRPHNFSCFFHVHCIPYDFSTPCISGRTDGSFAFKPLIGSIGLITAYRLKTRPVRYCKVTRKSLKQDKLAHVALVW